MAVTKLRIAFLEDDGEYIPAVTELLADVASKIRVFVDLGHANRVLLGEGEWANYDFFIIDIMMKLPANTLKSDTATDVNAGLEFHAYLEQVIGHPVPTLFLTGALLYNPALRKQAESYAAAVPRHRVVVEKCYGKSRIIDAIKSLTSDVSI